MLTLEEAIASYEKSAERYHKSFLHCKAHGGEFYQSEAESNKTCYEHDSQLAEWLRELQRSRVLLKATHDLLEAAYYSPYVENVLGILVHYDYTDCDGRCLMEDIEYHFDEFGEERRTDEIRAP